MGTKESKRAYQQLFSAVARTLKRHDPIGLIGMGAPADEYDLEVARILPTLRSAASHHDVAHSIHEIFARLFTEDEAGPAGRYEALSREVWSHWITFQANEKVRRLPSGGSRMNALHRAMGRFLAADTDFRQFDIEFMKAWLELGEEEISAPEEIRWEEVYDLVYMGAADPVHEEDRKVGVIGEADLRRRLAAIYPRLRGS